MAGAAADKHRLPALDVELKGGDTIAVGESVAQVFEAPGHTVGHIAYWFAGAKALFSADSLMVMGCGRLFEGTPEQMWETLTTLAALPDDTLVYSGHEYAESNAALRAVGRRGERRAEGARGGDCCNAANGRRDRAGAAGPRAGDEPVPTGGNSGFKARLGLESLPDAQVFAEIRRRKDFLSRCSIRTPAATMSLHIFLRFAAVQAYSHLKRGG